jgi:penicillin-binding protein 1A
VVKKKSNNTASKKTIAGRKKGSPQKKQKRKSFWKIIWSTALFFILLGGLFFILVFLGVLGPVPSKRQLKVINNPVASEVFSADGKILGRYYVENRSNVSFDEISPNVINALIATEDARFYEHRGIDEIALMRVLVKSVLLHNQSSGGGSTLSQQIAKNLFPRVDYGPLSMPVNKLREAIIAYRIERIYSKQEILALYLNTVPFAENVFGIEVAAERFFSKKPSQLDVDEAAVLIGMLKANNYYNPRTHPERSKGRRDVVIAQMVKNNYLTEEQGEKYKAQPLKIKYRVISYNQGPAPYFLEILKPQLLEWCENHTNEDGDPYNLYTDGLKITTTIDYNLQYYAQLSVKEYMKNIQRVFDSRMKFRDIFKENPEIIQSAIKNTNSYSTKTAAGLKYNDVLKEYDKKIRTTYFTWDGLKDTTVTRLDSLKHHLKLLNAGFIAIDPHNGNLKAWVGGIDFRFFKYDHVTAPRQTGSAFKPIVYLNALENGIEADKYFENQYKVYTDYDDWAPKNSHDEYGGYYTMTGALAKSLNTVSVEVLLAGGIDNTISLAKNLGISADLPDYPSLALGVASISLKDLTEAYAGIVNDGVPVNTYYLVQITDSKGNELGTFQNEQPAQPVVSSENCRAVIKMMEAVVDNGTGRDIRNVYHISGDFAGKTGTTQNNSDGWFMGVTPDLVTGCWVGADDPRIHFRSTTYGQGAYMALPIVGKFFNKTYHDTKYASLQYSTFKQPNEEMLALLEVPPYREMLDIDRHGFNLASIFGKKDKDAELQKSQTKKVNPEKEKKPVWTLIKSIFKKKK